MSRPALFLILTVASMNALADDPYQEMEITLSGNDDNDEIFAYRLMSPETVESGKRYPLILFLHGAGERGSDNESQLKYLPRILAEQDHRTAYPCFVLAPQCRTGKQWVDVPWSDADPTPIKPQATDQMKAAIQMLERTIKENPVDEDRVYLTGLSMGGYGSWELAARHPERFAAVAPVCGGGDPATASILKSLPIWAFHGDVDQVVPVGRTKRMIETIKSVGGSPKFTEYPGVAHNSWNNAYARSSGLMDWMFEQRRVSKN